MNIEEERLERENKYVLTAIQALLGLVAPSVEAIALQVDHDVLTLRFWVNGDIQEVSDDAQDVVAEVEAFLLPDNPLISVEVLSGSPPPDAYHWAGRMLYHAKRIR